MPRKPKRSAQLAKNAMRARVAIKRPEIPASDSPASTIQEARAGTPGSAISDATEDDPTFDPDKELASHPILKLEQYLEEWTLSLDRDDTISLGLFLAFHFKHSLNFTATKAAEYASMMMGRSDRTIRKWRADFMDTGEIAENKQGRYQRNGVLL